MLTRPIYPNEVLDHIARQTSLEGVQEAKRRKANAIMAECIEDAYGLVTRSDFDPGPIAAALFVYRTAK